MQVWDLITACQNQLRLSPMGAIAGLDLTAVLTMGKIKGYDLPLLCELLPAAEAGLLEGLSEHESASETLT